MSAPKAPDYLRDLYEETPVMMHAIDAEGRIEMVSNLWLKCLGYSREEVVGRRSTEFLTAKSRQYASEVILPAFFETGVCTDVQYEFVTKDGRIRDMLLSATAERDAAGRFVRSRAVLIDVTERYAAERDRERLQAQILHSQKLESLGVLAGGIAHDFNNLLVGILGNADLLLADLPADSPFRAYAHDITLTAQRAADLCRQLLAYSGRAPLSFGAVEVAGVVREMTQILDVSISKRATLELEVAPGLAPVHADATQLRQVFLNLIMNAAEAMPSGRSGGRITVRLEPREADRELLGRCLLGETLEPGAYVLVEVADNGSGMAPDTLERIFDPFFSTKFAGRGLGLAAVLGIVRSHRGALTLRSEPGRGTTIGVLLPVDQTLTLAEPLAAPALNFEVRGVALVVDDEPSVRNMAHRMLERLGFEVVEAADGDEGLGLVRSGRHDLSLIVLDMTMPKRGAAEILPELRQLLPSVPILLTSGYAEMSARGTIEGVAASSFLEKPFSFERFSQAVRRLLGKPLKSP